MPKTRRLFNKHNSTKFVLLTEARNEDGEKITQNCLVPVPHKRIPGNSLLIAKLAGVCGPPTVIKQKDDEKSVEEESKISKKKQPKKDSDEMNLEKIMDQFEDSDEDWISDSEDDDGDDDENLGNILKMNLLQNSCSSKGLLSNVHVEILEEGEEEESFFDEFGEGQFSDAEFSDEEENDLINRLRKKRSLTSSSKVDCPENIKLLNEGFEKILLEYTDDQIGALDDEEICGTFSTENKQIQDFIHTPLEKTEEHIEIGPCDEELKNKILKYSEDEVPQKIVEIVTEKPLEWDCESILSTYSNKYNHPYVIREESKKIRIPKNPLQKGLTKSKLRELDTVSEKSDSEEDDKFSVATSCNVRPKGETPEEKRERKNLFKEAQRESRKLKKENKLAFKSELKQQQVQALNNQKNKYIKLL